MKVIMFQTRFAGKVACGEKLQTIRAARKVPIRKCDELSLRAWTGLPYRSQQRVLKECSCQRVAVVKLEQTPWEFIITVDGEYLPLEHFDRFARRDGFEDIQELIAWFEATHGFPFVGQLICWA